MDFKQSYHHVLFSFCNLLSNVDIIITLVSVWSSCRTCYHRALLSCQIIPRINYLLMVLKFILTFYVCCETFFCESTKVHAGWDRNDDDHKYKNQRDNRAIICKYNLFAGYLCTRKCTNQLRQLVVRASVRKKLRSN